MPQSLDSLRESVAYTEQNFRDANDASEPAATVVTVAEMSKNGVFSVLFGVSGCLICPIVNGRQETAQKRTNCEQKNRLRGERIVNKKPTSMQDVFGTYARGRQPGGQRAENELSARQQTAIARRIAELERDNDPKQAIAIPGKPSVPKTQNARRIIQYQRQIKHWLDDEGLSVRIVDGPREEPGVNHGE